MYRALLAVTVLAATSTPVRGQVGPETRDPVEGISEVARLNLGMGPASSEGVALHVGLTLAGSGPHRVTARYTSVEEVLAFAEPSERVYDVGILYGREMRGRWGYLAASAGISMAGGMERGRLLRERYRWLDGSYVTAQELQQMGQCGPTCALAFLFLTREAEYEELPFRSVGLPLQAEVALTPLPWLGIGAVVFGNVNSVRSVTGVTLNVMLGDMR